MELLDKLDEAICQIENSIFERPFSAEKIKEKFSLLELKVRLGGDSGCISEQKDFYSDTFDEFTENITLYKRALENHPQNERVQQLFEKCEICKKELENLRNILDDYY